MDEGAVNRQWRRKLSALVALAETYLQCSFQFSFVSTIMPKYRITGWCRITEESRWYEGKIGERLLEITMLSHLIGLRCKSHFFAH